MPAIKVSDLTPQPIVACHGEMPSFPWPEIPSLPWPMATPVFCGTPPGPLFPQAPGRTPGPAESPVIF